MIAVNYQSLSAREKGKVRRQYAIEQNNKCFYCHEDLNHPPPVRIAMMPINLRLFPPGFLNHPVHLQHSHKTGLTEGAVHAYCNAVMFQYHNR